MKRLLRSLVMLLLVGTLTITSTTAYFTSTVAATGNVLQTGTLRAAIYTAALDGSSSWWVAYDNGTTTVLGTPLPELTNVAPGETRTVYYAIANHTSSTLPFHYRTNYSGTWSNGNAVGNVSVSNIRRVAQNGATCNADVSCARLRTDMNVTYTEASGAFYDDATVGTFNTGYYDHSETLQAAEYTIYKMDLTLDGLSTDNTYQGQTFSYDVNLDAAQVGVSF